MPRQLDILALEPFFGGARRHMLETLVRFSRHRWTLLKLPPRRMERRLTAAANWFSELLTRHWVGHVDLLFTSEAMNLSHLLRLTPELARHPSVVYFHDNQLPELSDDHVDRPLDLVNLGTAQAATEVWFNSVYHKRTFMIRAAALVERHPELTSRSPMPELHRKARLMPPPVDLNFVHEFQSAEKIHRNPRTVFVETRDANMSLLNGALELLRRRVVPHTLVTVGPVDDLDPQAVRWTLSENDEVGQVRAMMESGVVLSARPEASSDYQVVRALVAGCRPVLPDGGTYPEILPEVLHRTCLYDVDAELLADRLQEALIPLTTPWRHEGFRQAFRSFDAMTACRLFDERIEQLVNLHSAHN
jgi:hypothetical protein